MKTLYVSDLDGTLLTSEAVLSAYTCQTINRLTEQGMLFSYATARSFITATRATRGITARIPLVVYNGAFVRDNATGELLLSHFFGSEIYGVLDTLMRHEVYPIVYSLTEGREAMRFLESRSSRGMRAFLHTRRGDPRACPVQRPRDLYKGDIFYITCIDEPEKLAPLYAIYRDRFRCLFQRDIYSGEKWLEIMPNGVSKANAVVRLKQMLGCDRVVAFGDGENDLDLFQTAEESYAVANGAESLKQIASGVIGSNNEDGVARWLAEHYKGSDGI